MNFSQKLSETKGNPFGEGIPLSVLVANMKGRASHERKPALSKRL